MIRFNSILTILISFLLLNYVKAQDIQLFIKKGTIFKFEKRIDAGKIIEVQPADVIEISPSSLVLARNKGVIAEIAAGKTYTYAQLLSLFKKKKSFTKAFIEITINQQFSAKSSAGATTRGTSEDFWGYFPPDSVMIIEDSLTIKLQSRPFKLLTDIKLYHSASKDTVLLSKDKYMHRIPCVVPGEYFWEYNAQVGSEKKSYRNNFSVPVKSRKKELKKALSEYQKSLSDFSPEMQDQLLDEFCLWQKIYREK